jgi:hypothetical protein
MTHETKLCKLLISARVLQTPNQLRTPSLGMNSESTGSSMGNPHPVTLVQSGRNAIIETIVCILGLRFVPRLTLDCSRFVSDSFLSLRPVSACDLVPYPRHSLSFRDRSSVWPKAQPILVSLPEPRIRLPPRNPIRRAPAQPSTLAASLYRREVVLRFGCCSQTNGVSNFKSRTSPNVYKGTAQSKS